MQLCPVCCWEDAPGESPWNGSNRTSLTEAQYNFTDFGAAEADYIGLVREPRPEEARPPFWLSIEDLRLRVIGLIEEAFRKTTIEGGITLHQSLALDDIGRPSDAMLAEAALQDPETRWQDINDDKLHRFCSTMIFFDFLGLRFHLPAFMRHALQRFRRNNDADGVMFALMDGPDSEGIRGYIIYSDPVRREATFTLAQKEAIAAFLHFFGYSEDSIYRDDANKGLANGWARWTPDFLKLAMA